MRIIRISVLLLVAFLFTFTACASPATVPQSPTSPAQTQQPTAQPKTTPTQVPTITPTIPTPTKTNIVYITRTGEKYHSGGCQYLSQSQIPISLEEAVQRGYSPCSVCNPPKISSQISTPASQTQNTASDIVYITRTGEKYHRAGCRYLSQSQIPIERQEAIRRGYTPCSVCRP